jgi:hypothetical protein
METNQEKIMAKLVAYHEKKTAKLDAWTEGMEACVGKLETNPEKPGAIMEHQKVPKAEAAVESEHWRTNVRTGI